MASNRDEPLSFLNVNPSSSSPITLSDGDNYLIDPIGSASGSFQNEGLLAGDAGSSSDTEFGFTRSDFRASQLAGTVEFYQRHIFLCYKSPQVWPPRIEAAEFDRLPRLLSAAVIAKKADMRKETRLTICEGRDATETSNGDILIFPDMIRYRRLTHFDVGTFVEEVLVKDGEWLPGTPEKLKGSYVFVCSHGSRDRRCGVCGPALVTRFRDEIESHCLQGKVSVRPCSHIGGHKYAGNVIIFGSTIDGEVTGHWYGYVTPDDVPILLEQHLLKGEIVDWLWRGQMGLSEMEQMKSQELRFLVNGETNVGKSTSNITQIQRDEKNFALCASMGDRTGCCRENGSSCCQNPIISDKIESSDVNDRDKQVTKEKKIIKKKQTPRNNSGKGVFTRRACLMPTWIESWEQEDTLAALAAVFAAASVAFAYSCYKRLR